jgi:DNA-binding IclR family transcriptional regulator
MLTRADRLLHAFDESHRRLSLATLVERSGLPRSTTHRTASQMVALGWLGRRNGYYHVGDGLFEAASLAPARSDLRDVVLPYMQDLHEATRLTVQLGVLDGLDVILTEKITGHFQHRALNRVGSRLPAYASSLGRAILAYSPPEVVQPVLDGPHPARTRYTITSAEVLERELVAIPDRGWAVDREEGNLGLSCVGAPVIDPFKGVVAALSVTGPTSRVQPENLGPLVRITAAAASRALNGRFG